MVLCHLTHTVSIEAPLIASPWASHFQYVYLCQHVIASQVHVDLSRCVMTHIVGGATCSALTCHPVHTCGCTYICGFIQKLSCNNCVLNWMLFSKSIFAIIVATFANIHFIWVLGRCWILQFMSTSTLSSSQCSK